MPLDKCLSVRCRKLRRLLSLAWLLLPLLQTGVSADQYDTLRPSWQSNLINNGSSPSSIANYESINGGNLHGWFTGDGMTYLYLGNSDSEFDGDFWPATDPYHLPGTTVEIVTHANSTGEATTTTQNWVGGAQVQ
jgi:hypothetical protein